jgi:hypothetical protein
MGLIINVVMCCIRTCSSLDIDIPRCDYKLIEKWLDALMYTLRISESIFKRYARLGKQSTYSILIGRCEGIDIIRQRSSFVVCRRNFQEIDSNVVVFLRKRDFNGS